MTQSLLFFVRSFQSPILSFNLKQILNKMKTLEKIDTHIINNFYGFHL